jgi:glycosyltransferase involved in cell wall biosynthesis
MTLHGVVEQRLIGHGIKALLKNNLLSRVASSADVIYGVSRDILEHFEDVVKVNDKPKRVVIHNGIDLDKFSTSASGHNKCIIDKLDISRSSTLFGFLGRFMPQKGFNFIIDAMEILEKEIPDNEIVILAVGSGDYLDFYQNQISNKNLKHKFKFLPFQKNIGEVYKVLDAVLMPSIWEAYPLLVAESLCSGIPLIVSDCIGMREASKNTPAIVVKTGDSVALSKAMNHVYTNTLKGAFMGYAPIARKKFDVKITSKHLEDLYINTLKT